MDYINRPKVWAFYNNGHRPL